MNLQFLQTASLSMWYRLHRTTVRRIKCGRRYSKAHSTFSGVGQGDPISPVLFNAALEELMGRLHGKWATKRKYGINMGDRKLTNLRFADNLLLCASSFTSSREMLEDLMAESKKFGLDGGIKEIWP